MPRVLRVRVISYDCVYFKQIPPVLHKIIGQHLLISGVFGWLVGALLNMVHGGGRGQLLILKNCNSAFSKLPVEVHCLVFLFHRTN